MIRKLTSFLCVFIVSLSFSKAQQLHEPTFEETLSVMQPGGPILSPDGKHILFSVGTTDWENNRYDSEIWISKDGGEPFQLTNTIEGSSNSAQWSPDGQWIAFRATRGNKTQIQVIRLAGGEALAVTSESESVGAFRWSPNGKQLAFTRTEKVKDGKKRSDRYGKFAVEDNEYGLSTLWLIDFKPDMLSRRALPKHTQDSTEKASSKPVALIDSAQFTINTLLWSPDGSKIAFNKQPNPDILSFMSRDIALIDVNSREVSVVVANKGGDNVIDWSPDGKSLLYSSSVDNVTSNFFKNGRYFRIDINGKNNKELGAEFDENLNGLEWTPTGIYATAYQKTVRPLVKVDPKSGKVEKLDYPFARIYGFNLSKSGNQIAIQAENDNTLRDIYLGNIGDTKPTKITNFNKQIENWKYADSEVITWKSEDGAEVEGVLFKPRDYDPNRKYPLLVAIHGGPTGISRPGPIHSYVYPINQWLNKGALVLMPNYRGSAGYGEKFRSLNVRNLGVGDAWDVLSGVTHLEEQGLIDTSRMGCMGWSQGGYISAFITTNSNRFKAISVGAGISNWMTYYVNTDIHPFTRQYLEGTPWNDPEVYAKTSPMTNINQASTPTLIQHGEFDRRVPVPNAYELYQGLQDVGVETKLVIYKGFGHGITKPKERLAAVWHNWQWFLKHVWDEEVEMPIEK